MNERDSANADDCPMNLIDFARTVGDGSQVSRGQYVALMRRVLPLGDLENLSREEALWLYKAVDWLRDLAMLVHEFHEFKAGSDAFEPFQGSPVLPGPSGPYIGTVLTREDAGKPDFGPVFTFGLEGGVQ